VTTDIWTHIGFARTAALLASRAGLRFAPNRQPAAEAAMRRVLADLRLDDPIALARQTAADATVLDRLLAEVTIGETYFFREPAQLDVVRATVLPALAARRGRGTPVRAWSAGCASGEEAYTLAILLREGGLGAAARVLGTDVSRPRLAAAERARYTRWSLRGMSEEWVARYFTRRGTHFYLRPELRAAAEFRPLNLAAHDYAAAGAAPGSMDLVLCRNVMIYFDRQTVADVARRLLATLSEDGWLFLGASDPIISELAGCETVVTGAGLAYRRATSATVCRSK
jgi:chemotaxis protein methyltransferase CheR